MNTERPDNDDIGDSAEASGGGDARPLRSGEPGGTGEERRAGAPGEEKTDRAETPPAGEADRPAEESRAEGEPDREVVGAEEDGAGSSGGESTGKAADPDRERAEPSEGATEAAGTHRPRTDLGAEAADADAGEPEASDTASAAEPDGAVVDATVAEPREPGAEADEPEATADTGTDVLPVPAAAGALAEVPQPDPDSEVPRDEEADLPRSGRRRSPLVIAAVAAGVLLVGGGGAYFAATASGGSSEGATSGASGDDTPPLLALDGYSGSTGTDNGIAPGEPNPYGVTYRADGSLPEGPGSAPVYRTQGQVTEAEVTRLAEALGVDGKPVAQGQVWRIGAKDGSGPSLQVNRQAPGAWTFQRYSPGTDNCQSTTVCAEDPGTSTGDPVSAAAAEKAAAPVLKAVGQDDAKLDASQVMGAQRVVNAAPVVGGLPTYGWTTGVTVNAQGEVVGGTGQLKAPVKSDTYPVLSAEKTLGLLNKVPGTDHRMGIGGCASPVPLKDRLEAPCGESTSTASPAENALTVEKAVFGLASHFVDGRQALVPSWLFEVRATDSRDAFTVTYPAVDPTYLASSATATPTTPTSPSDEPTSAPETRDVKVDGYSVEGEELTVSFTGGVCGDYAATASETSGEVTAKVTYTPWLDKVCIMIAKEIQKTVPLDGPLGDREVVGSDGKKIPLEKAGAARLPETSGAQ